MDASAAGTGSGTSWANAMTTLQDGLAAGVTCASTEVWVAAGTYKPDQGVAQTPGDRFATFQLINGIAIYGGFPPGGGDGTFGARDIAANETILSGDLTGNDTPLACIGDSPDCDSNGGLCLDGFCIIAQSNAENSYHVVTGSNTNFRAVIDGFTIAAGNAAPGFPEVRGGGMLIDSGSPTVTDCTFSGNSSGNVGGGIYSCCIGNPFVKSCTFIGNSAVGRGGGMYNDSNNPPVDNCTFKGNMAGNGGGLYNISSSARVTNCIFSENEATLGGGVSNTNQASRGKFLNCIFSGN